MKPTDLRLLIQEGEGTTLEFKESLSSSFARELVAMANTIGGQILLGVRDDGTVVGVKDSNPLRARVHDIARNCDPTVKVRVDPVGLPKGMKLSDLGHKSIRRNGLLADLLHRIEFIEKAGTGIKRIRDEARAQGCPEPRFEETGFLTVTFYPNPDVRAQLAVPSDAATDQVGAHVPHKPSTSPAARSNATGSPLSDFTS